MRKKFFPLWKDKDIIILVTRKLSEKEFYNQILIIGSTLYGMADEMIIKAWMEDMKDVTR